MSYYECAGCAASFDKSYMLERGRCAECRSLIYREIERAQRKGWACDETGDDLGWHRWLLRAEELRGLL